MSYVGDGSVFSFVPDNCRVDPSSATAEGSAGFTIDAWRQYVQGLIPSFAAGIALGSISACGFALFLVWLCVRHRRRRVIKHARQAKQQHRHEAAASAQFMASDPASPKQSAPEPSCQQPGRCEPFATPGRLLKWAIVLFALAVVGVSAWGMAESIQSTAGLVDEFWLLVADFQSLATDLEASLASLAEGLDSLSSTLVTAQGLLQRIVDAIGGIPVLGPLLGKVVPLDTIQGFLGTNGDAAVGAIDDAVAALQGSVIPILNGTILPAIDSLESNRGWTTSLQDTWRYVVFSVLFGLLLLVSAAVAWACHSMRRGMLATALVACLWALNAVVCLLGLGLLNGAQTVANDACLYSEDLATRLVLERLEGDAQRIAQNALDYYLGKSDLADANGAPLLTNATSECSAELSAALLTQVTDIQLHQAIIYAWQLADVLPGVTGLLAGANLPTIPLVNFDLNAITDPLVATAEQLTGVLDDVCNVTMLLLRENAIQPLYYRAKAYVCCDLTDAIYAVWVPWVTAGVLSLVLCILASTRVIASTLRPSGATGRPGGGNPEPAQVQRPSDGSFIKSGAALELTGGTGGVADPTIAPVQQQ